MTLQTPIVGTDRAALGFSREGTLKVDPISSDNNSSVKSFHYQCMLKYNMLVGLVYLLSWQKR